MARVDWRRSAGWPGSPPAPGGRDGDDDRLEDRDDDCHGQRRPEPRDDDCQGQRRLERREEEREEPRLLDGPPLDDRDNPTPSDWARPYC
ncbi:MAG: hypothetical protein VKM01_07590 [Cyanobacteriota bacterium]|nr:hypothetical protein [Cyanobacteriota bacterium]